MKRSSPTVSNATRQNWQRLNADTETKLRNRANKTRSEKRIFPLEYLESRKNIRFAENLLALSAEYSLSRREVIFALAVALLKQQGILQKDHVRKVLEENNCPLSSPLCSITVPENEWDIPGFVYQCLLSEGEKNISGSYYTPRKIAEAMTADTDLTHGETFCDPCCGSGAFLLAVHAPSPLQLWGCDKDPIAVFAAKINLLCRYKDHVFSPQIFCCDYLTDTAFSARTFDVIATNPPWGAEKNRQKESFSLFFRKAAGQTKEGGTINFLLPEAVLRIRTHRELRRFILQKHLEKIRLFQDSFTGVMTKFVAVRIRNASPAEHFELQRENSAEQLSVSDISNHKDQAFIFLSEEDRRILDHVSRRKHFYLSSRSFALGIVTGDNKNKVKDICENGMEPVFTGKEISRYVLKTPVRFLRYDKKSLQQTAGDDFYRAPEKLVYKFISDKLVFAYDSSGSLFLNSANIVIPDIPGMSIKTALAFLNSRFLRYYYSLMFSDIKILKSSLMQLPFPQISSGQNAAAEALTDRIFSGCSDAENELQQLIYRCYHLSQKQIKIIERHIFENMPAEKLD